MAISRETLRGIIRDYQGLEVSDEELDHLLPEIENYVAAVQELRELDLSDVMSGRLLNVDEGGEANA
jgi:Asp-tRNA(Asn)/Glu-tRNA(Gln) amidotransferase C subunit